MCKVTMIMRVICFCSHDKDFQDRDCPFADKEVALLGQEEELKPNQLWTTFAWLWFWYLYSKYKTGISFIFWHSRGPRFWFPSAVFRHCQWVSSHHCRGLTQMSNLCSQKSGNRQRKERNNEIHKLLISPQQIVDETLRVLIRHEICPKFYTAGFSG